MNNQRVVNRKSFLALEMSFIGLLAWVVFSSLIAWQGAAVQAGNEGASQQMQRPVAQASPAVQGNPDGRSVPPEGAPSRTTAPVPAIGTPNSCTGFDFESGAQGFTVIPVAAGAPALWHLDNALCRAFLTGHSTPFTFYYGLDASCNYNTGDRRNASNLVSPPINVTGTFAPFTVGFNYLLFVESSSSFDTTFVDISTDGGTTWTQILSKANLINDNQWHNVSVDVTSQLGAATSARLRFRFDSVDTLVNSSTGWHVDDVLVCGQPFDYLVQDDSSGDYIKFNSVTGRFETKQCKTGFIAQGTAAVMTTGVTIMVQNTAGNLFIKVTVDLAARTAIVTVRVVRGLSIVAYDITDSNIDNNSGSCPGATP